MNITSQFSRLRLSDHSEFLTFSHLEELNVTHDQLDTINKYIELCREHCADQRLPKVRGILPFTCHIHFQNPTMIKVRVIFPKIIPGATVHSARLKKIKKSISFEVDFSSNLPTVSEKKTVVLRHVKERVGTGGLNSSFNNYPALKTELPSEIAKDIPTFHVIPYTSRNGEKRVEIELPRFDDGLLKAVHARRLCLSQGLSALSTIGKTIQVMHDAGFILGNVKPSKIFLAKISDAQFQPSIQDYRWVCKPGHIIGAHDYIYWDALSKNGTAFANSDVYGLAVSAFTVLIRNFMLLANPQQKRWLYTEEGQAKLLCYALLDSFTEISDFLQSAAKSVPALLNCISACIARKAANGESIEDLQLLLAETKAQASIISIMAREENNSDTLLAYYKSRNWTPETKTDFIQKAKEEIPTLSTAESLANELHEIHLDLTPTKHLFRSSSILEPLKSYCMQAGLNWTNHSVLHAVKWQLLERPSETRISKKVKMEAFTFATRSIDAHRVRLQIIYPRAIQGAILGAGAYKRTKKSISVLMKFTPLNEVEIQIEKTALQRFKKNEKIMSVDRMRQEAEQTLRIHQELIGCLPPGTKIVPVPHIRRYTNSQGEVRIEVESARFDSDLAFAAVKNDTVDKSVSMLLLSQIGDVLQSVHDAGFVHQDVANKNILVRQAGPKGHYEAYLNDFDKTACIGFKDRGANYDYWDACAKAGIALPNTDVYGLIACAVEILVRGFGFDKILALFNREKSVEAVFCKILQAYGARGLDRSVMTVAEMVKSCEQQYLDRYAVQRTRAQAKIIEILAREIDNSNKLFEYYTKNKESFKDIKCFLNEAKIAIPRLSTARSVAKELREISEIFTS